MAVIDTYTNAEALDLSSITVPPISLKTAGLAQIMLGINFSELIRDVYKFEQHVFLGNIAKAEALKKKISTQQQKIDQYARESLPDDAQVGIQYLEYFKKLLALHDRKLIMPGIPKAPNERQLKHLEGVCETILQELKKHRPSDWPEWQVRISDDENSQVFQCIEFQRVWLRRELTRLRKTLPDASQLEEAVVVVRDSSSGSSVKEVDEGKHVGLSHGNGTEVDPNQYPKTGRQDLSDLIIAIAKSSEWNTRGHGWGLFCPKKKAPTGIAEMRKLADGTNIHCYGAIAEARLSKTKKFREPVTREFYELVSKFAQGRHQSRDVLNLREFVKNYPSLIEGIDCSCLSNYSALGRYEYKVR